MAPDGVNTATSGPPPGPAAPTTSALPSPSTSPAATRTPPVKDGSKAKNLKSGRPVASETITSGPPPAPAPVAMTFRGTGVTVIGVTATGVTVTVTSWSTLLPRGSLTV